MPPTPKTPRIKHLANVVVKDSKGHELVGGWGGSGEREFFDNYGRSVFLHLPVGTVVGKKQKFTVTIEYLGEKQYKQTYAQRVKSLAASEKRRERWEKERAEQKKVQDEKELLQRRKRIMNQVELAFVKNDKTAVDFVTCDECNAPATFLGLTHENPGSQVIDPDQITGAWCNQHDNQHKRPYKTTATIACNRLEFFYDGLRQIYVKDAVEFAAPQAV